MLREEISRNAILEISLEYRTAKKTRDSVKNLEVTECSIGAAASRFAFLKKFLV